MKRVIILTCHLTKGGGSLKIWYILFWTIKFTFLFVQSTTQTFFAFDATITMTSSGESCRGFHMWFEKHLNKIIRIVKLYWETQKTVNTRILIKCYCVEREMPIKHEKIKLQAAMVCGFEVCLHKTICKIKVLQKISFYTIVSSRLTCRDTLFENSYGEQHSYIGLK